MIRPRSRMRAQSGTSMIEVLVSIVIVVVGLLGLAGLQSRATLAEMESFQRAQALVLLQDMVDRINANRKEAMAYVTTDPVNNAYGTGRIEVTCSGQGAARDTCEWTNLLLGAAESQNSTSVGAMIGARGCVVALSSTMPRRLQVSVVWQGLNPTVSPTSTDCGKNHYGTGDLARRAVTANVQIACLQNDPVSLLCVTP
jgi:type IV pilus assembly protein PilV